MTNTHAGISLLHRILLILIGIELKLILLHEFDGCSNEDANSFSLLVIHRVVRLGNLQGWTWVTNLTQRHRYTKLRPGFIKPFATDRLTVITGLAGPVAKPTCFSTLNRN
jgi:hypothetical protein